MFGDLSRQRVSQIAAEPGFPAPVAILATGRVWERHAVAAWARENGRAGPGHGTPPAAARQKGLAPVDIRHLTRMQIATARAATDHLISLGAHARLDAELIIKLDTLRADLTAALEDHDHAQASRAANGQPATGPAVPDPGGPPGVR